MNKKLDIAIKVVTLLGGVLSLASGVASGWAENKRQEIMIDKKIDEAIDRKLNIEKVEESE